MWTLRKISIFYILVFAGIETQGKEVPKQIDLSRASFKEILDHYTFVDDFLQKEEERPLKLEGVYWKYPYQIPHYQFQVPKDFGDTDEELPSVEGDDRAAEHYNFGRVLFREKKFEDARKAFLTARAKYGKSFAGHRRGDYYLALAFLKSAHIIVEKLKTDEVTDLDVKVSFGNTTTFLSWAFIKKKDIPDTFLDKVTPKALYTLAAIYFNFGRFSGAYGAATEGLNFLRKTGRTEYRAELAKILIETMIQSRDYLSAIQNIDTSIRQNPDLPNVANLFSDVGDIYFDLNNYELAQDTYSIAARLNELQNKIDPLRQILMGESLFWEGRFEEAKKAFANGIDGSSSPKATGPVAPTLLAYAQLRVADISLVQAEALKTKSPAQTKEIADLLTQTKLGYFRAIDRFSKEEIPVAIARMRLACLELPYYLGNNVKHARQSLDEIRSKGLLPPKAIELSWACKVGSFTDRERTQDMLERVREFAKAYPQSGFLKNFENPLKEFRRKDMDQYVERGSPLEIIGFYEANQKTLFPNLGTLTDLQKQKLFLSYIDNFQPDKARDFWPSWRKGPKNGLDLVRAIVFLSEQKNLKTDDQKDLMKSIDKAESLSWKSVSIPSSFLTRVLSTKWATTNGAWITKYYLENHTEKKLDLSKVCTEELPLYGKLKNESNLMIENFKTLRGLSLKKLVELDDPCGETFLEIEKSYFSKTKENLSEVWKSRLSWKPTKTLIKAMWEASESLMNKSKKDDAMILWKFISDKAPKGSMERKFATFRLSPQETQLEKLWD